MSDYISRDEAEKRIDEALSRVFAEPVGKSILSKLPTADVKPVVMGRWIDDCDRVAADGWTYKQRHCSECGRQTFEADNFCPNCGADMREEAQ